ncbi:MAG: DNA-formamidopyrimidine glycosylase [Kiritimatiellia bacterium]
MPELPEVETVVRGLRAKGICGRKISGVSVNWRRSVQEPAVEDFIRILKGKTIQNMRRRGKFAVMDLSDGWTALIHLRMSGRLFLGPAAAVAKHDHVVLSLDDGRVLRFHDTRKFGRWILTQNPDAVLDRLGPEPLDGIKDFHKRLRAKSRTLKLLLLDQTFIAGLGNIYVDEALWEARIHPLRKSDSLTADESAGLLKAIRTVLNKGIRNLGTSLGHGQANFQLPGGESGRNREALNVFRQTGLPCPRCGEPIERIKVGQRSTHICPDCQHRGS